MGTTGGSGEAIWRPRCDECGRFTGRFFDCYTSWGDANGGAGTPEPYDPTYLCRRCAGDLYDRSLARILEHGLLPSKLRPYWQSPDAWSRAVHVARGMRKHGLWTPPERHEVAREDFMARVVWCVCGWSMPLSAEPFAWLYTRDKIREHAGAA